MVRDRTEAERDVHLHRCSEEGCEELVECEDDCCEDEQETEVFCEQHDWVVLGEVVDLEIGGVKIKNAEAFGFGYLLIRRKK